MARRLQAVRRPPARGSGGGDLPSSGRGFSLLEVTVALALVMLLSGLVAAGFSPWLGFQQRQDTEARLARLGPAWEHWLDQHAAEIEGSASDAGLEIAGQRVPEAALPQDAGTCAALSQALDVPPGLACQDGFNQAWIVRLSHGLVQPESGINLHYHVLALLSSGPNGRLEPATRFDPESGELRVAGDDQGIRIDGLSRARTRLQVLAARIERAANAWQAWFQVRWQGDSERDASIDYFAGPCPGDPLAPAWDASAGALPSGCGSDLDASVVAATLGLSPPDVEDGTGGHLQFDSSSALTRNPDQTDPDRRSPPYSAAVWGSLPGGSVLRRSVLGTL